MWEIPSVIIIFAYLKNGDLIDSLKVPFRVCHVNANLFMKAKELILCQIQNEYEVWWHYVTPPSVCLCCLSTSSDLIWIIISNLFYVNVVIVSQPLNKRKFFATLSDIPFSCQLALLFVLKHLF